MFDPHYIGQVAAVAAVVKDQLAARDAGELNSGGPMTASDSANATSGEDIDRAAAFNINDMPAEAEAAGTAENPAEQPAEHPAEASPDPAATTAKPSDDMPPASETPAADSKIEQVAHTQKTVEPVPGNWREQTQAVLTSVEKELTSNTISESQRTHLNGVSRLLHAILNDTEKALAPIENADEDEREFWKHMVHGLMISLDADEKNPTSRRSALTLRSIRLAADYLANVSTLDVRNVAFCSKVESYGRFDEFKSYGFKPGQEVLLYVEVENFAVESRGERHETELQGEYTIFGADGKRVANAVLPLDKQASNNRRRDYFIPYRIFMPKKIEQGHYTLQLTMEDVKGSKSNQASVEFWIR